MVTSPYILRLVDVLQLDLPMSTFIDLPQIYKLINDIGTEN
jgi:hypothetical protein